MRHPIDKERLHLMSPAVNVCAIAAWDRPPEAEALKRAVQTVVSRHAILHARAALDADGSAWLEEAQAARPVALAPFDGSVERLIARQDATPFAIDEGETVRFFWGGDAERPALVVIAHHLVCDGGSLMILMRDLLLAVNGQPVAERPIRLLKRGELPAHPGLDPFTRLMMKNTNARWQRSGKVFDMDAYRRMFAAYAASRPTALALRALDAERLLQCARRHGVTVNSLLAAALAGTLPRGESVGMAVSERPEGYEGLGNFAVALGARAAYDPKKRLPQNAEALHRQIARKLASPRERYFLHEFMGALKPTLVDSIYFSAYGGYENELSRSLCHMCGYVDQPKGVTLTNLKAVEMPDDPGWAHRYAALRFVPPRVPNVRAVIGASTYRGETTLALRTDEGERGEPERERFRRACEALDAL